MNSLPSCTVDPIHYNKFFIMPGTKAANQSKKDSKKTSNKKQENQPKMKVAKAPAAYGSINRMEFGRLRELKVCHTEPILTVAGTTTTAVTRVRMNPGLPEFAPWLSGIAANFESYRVDSIAFRFVTRAGSTKTGRVVMSVDYDALDATPTTFLQVSNYEDSVASASWEHSVLRCSRRNLTKLKERYIRQEPDVSDQDLRLSDTGNFFIWVEGQDNTNAVGDVYVSYDLTLLTPQSADGVSGLYGGAVNSGGTLSAANPLGTASVTDADSRGFSCSDSVVTFNQPGLYQMSCLVNGGTLTAVSMTAGAGATSTGLIAIANGASTSATRSNYILVSVPGATVTVAATAVSVSSAGLYVSTAPFSSLALYSALLAKEFPHVSSCPVSQIPNCPLDVGQRICVCSGKRLGN